MTRAKLLEHAFAATMDARRWAGTGLAALRKRDAEHLFRMAQEAKT